MTNIEVIQTETGIYHDDGTGELMPVVCHWFARCVNQAMTTRNHPILGDVPICTRCDDKCEGMS